MYIVRHTHRHMKRRNLDEPEGALTLYSHISKYFIKRLLTLYITLNKFWHLVLES